MSKVLFLIESGSRGWGWESEDSDYDMRGVFVQDHNKLKVEPEQINRKVNNFDIELWDLKKFIRLMVDSNPSTWEWLSSELVYIDHKLREILKQYFERDFSPSKLKKHYVSMARANFHKYINQIGDNANLKKYVYVIRSIACVLWIEKNHTPPPKHYKYVAELLPDYVKEFFYDVIRQKRESESIMGSRNKEVEKYIISFFDKEFIEEPNHFNIEELEEVVKHVLD